MNDIQKLVQETLDQLVESGAETGLQAAVYLKGKQVADAVAGVADSETGRAVTPDTPFWSASTGKGVTSTVVHVLVERGVLDYDTRVVEWWPEFGAHGKQAATLRHVLTHSTGVPAVPAETTIEDLADWDKMTSVIAGTEPWWEPGTKTGYHGLTWGYIVGEIVRRATGKPISQVLREDVAEPLGIADELYLGVPVSELGRLARIQDVPGQAEMFASLPLDTMPPLFKASPPAVTPNAAYANNHLILTSDIPAGGTMTARAVARMYAALLADVDGVRLVSPDRLKTIADVAVDEYDEMTAAQYPKALGYNIGRPGTEPNDTLSWFGYPGMGGSLAYADTTSGVSFAVTKNVFNMADTSTGDKVAEVVAKVVAEG